MQSRPVLKTGLTSLDKCIESACVFLLLATWAIAIIGLWNLPGQIPSHFNFAGEADDSSNRWTILLLPFINSLIFLGMTLLNRHPHLYNYPAPVTAENARQLYTGATRMIRTLKLVVVQIFAAIVVLVYHSALNPGSGLGKWFLPASLFFLFIPLWLFIIRSGCPLFPFISTGSGGPSMTWQPAV